ncbi:Protocadherin-like wing polarity protein stan-like 2, partial [Homarus americanus]
MVLVPDTTPVGHKIFLANLDGPTRYKLDSRWTASYVHRLLHVDHTTGAVVVKRPLDCAGTFLYKPYHLVAEAWSEARAPLDYASVPLALRAVTTPLCLSGSYVLDRHSGALCPTRPDPSDPDRLCPRRSQDPSLLPRTMQACKLVYNTVSDHRLTVETHGGDLVSLIDTCLTGITKVKLGLRLRCPGWRNPTTRHVLVSTTPSTPTRDITSYTPPDADSGSYFERNLRKKSEKDDGDHGDGWSVNSPLTYSIQALLDDRSQRMFEIDPTTGVVTTKRKLDRELVDVHYFRVKAVDKAASPPRSATTRLQINVDDANDHEPVFEKRNTIRRPVRKTKSGELSTRLMLDREHSHYRSPSRRRTRVPPHRLTATTDRPDLQWVPRTSRRHLPVIAHIQANDHDSVVERPGMRCNNCRNTAGHFTIDGMTGEVRVASHLDHETNSQYSLVIRAQDNGSPPRSNTTQLLVNVRDVNDNVPRFLCHCFKKTVKRMFQSAIPSSGFKRSITTPAITRFCRRWGEPSSRGGGFHRLDLTRRNRREENHHYTFTVVSASHRHPTDSGPKRQQPIFDPLNYEVSVAKRNPRTPVITDESQLHYAITLTSGVSASPSPCRMDEGLVSLAQPLDFNRTKVHLTVTATDAGVLRRCYHLRQRQHCGDGGSFCGDTENAHHLHPEWESFPSLLSHPSTGAITTTKPLDRRLRAATSVNARDNGTPQLSDTTDVEITVVDVNDNAPVFSPPSYRASVPETPRLGHPSSRLRPVTPTEDPTADGWYIRCGEDGRTLDRETEDQYSLVVLAVDDGPSSGRRRLRPHPALHYGENSPVGRPWEVRPGPDTGPNARIQYSIVGGLMPRTSAWWPTPPRTAPSWSLALTSTTNPQKKYQLNVRAMSEHLRSEIPVTIHVVDVNDNAPVLSDFRIIFKQFKTTSCGPIGRVPAMDADDGPGRCCNRSDTHTHTREGPVAVLNCLRQLSCRKLTLTCWSFSVSSSALFLCLWRTTTLQAADEGPLEDTVLREEMALGIRSLLNCPNSTSVPTLPQSLLYFSPYSTSVPTLPQSLLYLSPYSTSVLTLPQSLLYLSPYSTSVPTLPQSLLYLSPLVSNIQASRHVGDETLPKSVREERGELKEKEGKREESKEEGKGENREGGGGRWIKSDKSWIKLQHSRIVLISDQYFISEYYLVFSTLFPNIFYFHTQLVTWSATTVTLTEVHPYLPCLSSRNPAHSSSSPLRCHLF